MVLRQFIRLNTPNIVQELLVYLVQTLTLLEAGAKVFDDINRYGMGLGKNNLLQL